MIVKNIAKSVKYGSIDVDMIQVGENAGYFKGSFQIDGVNIVGHSDYLLGNGGWGIVFYGAPIGINQQCFIPLVENWKELILAEQDKIIKQHKPTLKFYNGDTLHNIGFWAGDIQLSSRATGAKHPNGAHIRFRDIASRAESSYWRGEIKPPEERDENGVLVGLVFDWNDINGLAEKMFSEEINERAEERRKLDLAKSLGKPVLMSSQIGDSQEIEPGIESTTCTIERYAMPDGNVKTKIIHHY